MESLLSADGSLAKASPIKYQLQKFYLSNYVHLIYGLFIIITIFSITWILFDKSYHRNIHLEDAWFIAVEIILCSLVLLDLCFRIYLIGFLQFTRSVFNLLDILLTVSCVTELIIAFIDIFVKEIGTLIAFVILFLKNIFMVARIVILMKRSLTSRKNNKIVVHEEYKRTAQSLDTILETNREHLRKIYRSKLDTLEEADEACEDSLNQRHDVWKGRVSQGEKKKK